jgi:hypothetical protein
MLSCRHSHYSNKVDLTPDQSVRSSLEAMVAPRLAFRRQFDPAAAAVLAVDLRNRIDSAVADLASIAEAADSSIPFLLGFPSDLLLMRKCLRFPPPPTATPLRNSLVSS